MINKKESQEWKLEIKSRKELLKRLSYPLEQLRRADEKEEDQRAKQAIMLSEYESVEDAQEAYGYGHITEAEYDLITDIFEGAENAERLTPVSLALKILMEFMGQMQREIRSIEWEMLSPEERERIARANEARKAEIEARRVARHGD